MKIKSKCFFLILISLLILIPSILMISPIKLDIELSGVMQDEKPILTVEGIMDGTYQQAMEVYHSQTLGGREAIIRVGNQMVYSLFHKSTHSAEAIGKNGQLYELEYIYKKLQYIEPVSQEYAEELVDKLERLQSRLQKRDIKLFVFITPSKAEIYPEEINDIFYKCASYQEDSSYNKFLSELTNSTVPFYDGAAFTQVLKEYSDNAVFAKTGTHWTQVTGAMAAAQLVKELENQLGYDMTEFEVEKNKVDTPLEPDTDIFNLLNIIQKPYDNYFTPTIHIVKQGTEQPAVICRGGSFMGQSITWLINNDIFGSSIHMENTYVYQEKYTDLKFFSNYNELDISELLDHKDIMLLEVNQAAIDSMSFGFIDYLLDSDILN